MGKATVKYCPKCSGIKKKHVRYALEQSGAGKGCIATGCIGDCLNKHPELKGMAFAKIEGKLVACDSPKKLAKKMAAALS